MKKIAILQSNYIPWKGYFDMIAKVDEFIFHDDLQYTKNDWRNRNKIKTKDGTIWLTIPCGSNEKRLISEVLLNDCSWQKKHMELIYLHYKKAPYYEEIRSFLENTYLTKKWNYLSEVNQFLIKYISKELLKIDTQFKNSTDYQPEGLKSDRVLSLCKQANADIYLSGPSAQNYLKVENFFDEGIEIEWMDYSKYSEYPQLHPPFVHGVSILDMIFNIGIDDSQKMFVRK
jgi:hypothetical protein